MSVQRYVQDNLIISEAQPAVRIEVDESLTYVGTTEFTIYGIAQAEAMLFVAASEGNILRQLLVQFEHFLPHTDPDEYRYRYNTGSVVTKGGIEFQTDLRCVPSEAYQELDPESDTAQVKAFLNSKGYQVPHQHGDQVATRRFIRVLDDTARSELLFVYKEAVMAPNTLDTDETDTWLVHDSSALGGFDERARASFRIVE